MMMPVCDSRVCSLDLCFLVGGNMSSTISGRHLPYSYKFNYQTDSVPGSEIPIKKCACTGYDARMVLLTLPAATLLMQFEYNLH